MYTPTYSSNACRYDQTASKIDKQSMAEGVAESEYFLLFLSSNLDGAGTLGREFCQFEIREAVKLQKKIITIHETGAWFYSLSALLHRA